MTNDIETGSGVCGLVLEEETADETIEHIYDPHGREERTDRRAHGEADFRTVAEFVYSPMGDLVERRTYTNATDYVTERFAYDHEGREIASTNALGGVVTTSYDPRGNVTAVDGATYPLRMEYDLKGRRTALTTFRDAGGAASSPPVGDTTRWTLDPATGLSLSKTYADGYTVSYTYTPDGLPARTTWPGGRWQENGYNAKREVVSTERSDGEETTFAYDAYSREVAATNDSASIEYARDGRGRATNVTTTVAGEVHSLVREFDAAGRLSRVGDLFYGYDAEGRLSIVSNAAVAVEYQYAADGLDSGYSLTLPGGAVFTRSVTRDALRRSLMTGIASSFSGNTVEGIAYSYDALGRPVVRNADAFGYNERSEVTSASIMGWAPSPSTASYGYDGIGNLQLSSFNAATNTYTANSLNQYTSIQEISAPSAPPREPTYDLDGNMLSDGVVSFTYDAASRLKTVSSNGVTLVTNFYDAKSRRVKKVTPNATTTFFYDDWNLVEERIAYADNTSSTIRYYWGKDLSGTLQGAGGVGGLLWLTIDGVVYIPCYDNNGNITRYLNANGGTFARYSYDAFGRLIARAGRRASFFRHRFSTKYSDTETGLYYYGYRFYHPVLMRWLNRDPIGENGGVNVYAFVENAVLDRNDLLGLSFGFLGPSSGTTGEISLASNEREPGKDVWFAVFGDEQFNVRRKINYKLCTCSDNNNHGGGRHIQKAFDYYSERKPCSWMYFGQSYFGEGVKMEYAELISMDYPDSKGTIEVEIQILPLGVKPTNVEIWSAEKAGIDAEIEGFGTEKRSGYGDSSSTHGIRNYIIKDKDWRPSTTIATVKFVILADCGDMPMLKERPVVTGNWTLNGKGWRRMVGNLGGQRGEGITLPVKGE